MVGRGFGVVDVDSAEHPWTLDNPAYHWFGARLDRAGHVAGRRRHTARSGWPRWSPTPDGPACGTWSSRWSGPGSPRPRRGTGAAYGALDVDSNLPDVRIAVGGPDAQRVHRRGAGRRRPGVRGRAGPAAGRDRPGPGLGAGRRPLPEVWVPSADLRGVRALPVLVARRPGRRRAGRRGAPSWPPTSADADRRRRDRSPVDGGRGLADVSVAMLNRGLPGLRRRPHRRAAPVAARSCTGWPSGGLDRQAAPHGPGRLQVPAAALDAHVRVRARVRRRATGGRPGSSPPGRASPPRRSRCVEPAHPGPLPPAHSLLAVDPPGAAVVTAVKPVGTPLASGTAPTPPAEALAVRLYEAHGRPGHRAAPAGRRVAAAERADLLDRPTGPLAVGPDGAVELPLAPCEVATVLLRPATAAAGDEPLVPEPAGVVPARYWLENAGPAPAGNLPVSVHASAEPGGRPGRAARLGRLVAGRRRVDRRRRGDRAGGLGRAAGGLAGRAAARAAGPRRRCG